MRHFRGTVSLMLGDPACGDPPYCDPPYCDPACGDPVCREPVCGGSTLENLALANGVRSAERAREA